MATSPFRGWVAGHIMPGLLLAAALTAQTPPLATLEGYASTVRFSAIGVFRLGGFTLDPQTDDAYLTLDDELLRQAKDGVLTRLVKLGGGARIGMLKFLPQTREVLFTDFNTHVLHRHHLRSGRTTRVPGVKNAFDSVVLPSGELLITANPTWPNNGAETSVYLMGSKGQPPREIIRLVGASGPLVLTPTGDLVCALLPYFFPTPRGTVRLVRFSRGQLQRAIQGAAPLPLSSGTIVATGLDGAYDLAYDDRGRLLITDPQHGGIRRTLPNSFRFEPTPLVPPSNITTLDMVFDSRGTGVMAGYQHAGARLLVATTDWARHAEIRTITPQRPSLETAPSSRPGPLPLRLMGAPPSGDAFLAVTTMPPHRNEQPFAREAGIDLVFALDWTAPFILLTGRTDNTGAFAWRLQNPGGITTRLFAQALVLGRPRPGVYRNGTSAPIHIDILPK